MLLRIRHDVLDRRELPGIPPKRGESRRDDSQAVWCRGSAAAAADCARQITNWRGADTTIAALS
jgi:hypothetical protein